VSLSARLPQGPLEPFKSRAYRFQWPADLLTSWAFEMETLILGWYILVETRSVVLLTIFSALQFFGSLFSPMFGAAADRIGHRTVLVLMRAAYGVLAAALMLLAFAGQLTPHWVLVIAFLSGLIRPSDMGMRTALMAQAMSPALLVAAMGISRTTSDSARIAGAIAGAGLFGAFGMGKAYIVVVAFYVLGCLLTLGAAPPQPTGRTVTGPPGARAVGPSLWRDLWDGLVYVWRTPRLLAMMWLAFLVNLTAFPLSNGLLPYVAKNVYGITQTGLGYLVASFAGGALCGSIALSLTRRTMHLERVMMLSSAAWYVLLLAFAQMRNPYAGALMLFGAGFAQSLSMVSMAVMLVRTAEERLRGRVMGARMLAIYSLPLGLIVAGFLVERIGFHSTATAYAVAGLLLTFAIALRWRSDIWQTRS